MEQIPINNSNSTLQNIIKVMPALGIGVTSICFIMGLLIVNIHLGRYGVYSSEFIRTDYILVGAVFISLIFTVGICFGFSIQQFEQMGHLWKNREYIKGLLLAILSILLTVAPILLILGFLIEKSRFSSLKEIILPFGTVSFIWLFVYKIYIKIKLFIQSAKYDQQKNNTLIGIAHDASVIVPLLLIGITMYATAIYPYISTAWGGGHKASMMLFPTDRGLAVCKALSLPLLKNQTVAGPIRVLTESEKELIILVPDGISEKELAIRLKRELFDAVQTLSSRDY